MAVLSIAGVGVLLVLLARYLLSARSMAVRIQAAGRTKTIFVSGAPEEAEAVKFLVEKVLRGSGSEP